MWPWLTPSWAENNQAIERLVYFAKTPGGSDYGQLKFNPAWAGLRGDARFVKIVDGLQPNSARRQSADSLLDCANAGSFI
ncbi:MAG: hypothetical protein DMF14_04635 [Verrucomicrobia bacterium]|nr:MAG: hypothetical protein DMF23_13025 [Verrucomicrobiota bacterium]PYL92234.1 MAG: hypothetical protein DMF14_04635 [Verrucomicrobiota bacterium]